MGNSTPKPPPQVGLGNTPKLYTSTDMTYMGKNQAAGAAGGDLFGATANFFISSIHDSDQKKKAALHFAAMKGDLEEAKKLLDAKYHPNFGVAGWLSPISYAAAAYGHAKVLKLFLR